MIEYEIECVNKDDDGDIIKIGYYDPCDKKVFLISREEAIKQIESGKVSFYTFDKQKAKVVVYAKDFLRSTADETTYNNLDNLRLCGPPKK